MPSEIVARLIENVPPPPNPDTFLGKRLNAAHGPSVPLPDDYIEFMHVFGPGWFTEDGHPCLQILDLAGDTDIERVQLALQTAEEAHSCDPRVFPTPPYPHIPGLLPWGIWEQGFDFYWLVTTRTPQWQIAINARDQMESYSCSFAEYLLGNLARQSNATFRTYLMEEDVDIRYCPTSRVDDCCRGDYKP